MRSAFIGLSAICLLSACAVDSSSQSETDRHAAVSGVVALEEVSGADWKASFRAHFSKRVSGQRRSGRWERALRKARAATVPHCDSVSVPKPRKLAVSTDYLSIGRLTFGPVSKAAVMEAEENFDHHYQKALETGMDSGTYQVTGEGTGDVPAFAETLSLPEVLNQPTLNRFHFDEGIRLRRGESMKFNWQPPTSAHNENILLVQLRTENENEIRLVQCGVRENSLANAGNWEIPSSELDKLPSVPLGTISFVRAHVRDSGKPGWKVQLQGLRTQLGLISTNN